MKKNHPWNKAIKADTVGRTGGAESRLKAARRATIPPVQQHTDKKAEIFRKKKYKTKWATEVDGDWSE